MAGPLSWMYKNKDMITAAARGAMGMGPAVTPEILMQIAKMRQGAAEQAAEREFRAKLFGRQSDWRDEDAQTRKSERESDDARRKAEREADAEERRRDREERAADRKAAREFQERLVRFQEGQRNFRDTNNPSAVLKPPRVDLQKAQDAAAILARPDADPTSRMAAEAVLRQMGMEPPAPAPQQQAAPEHGMFSKLLEAMGRVGSPGTGGAGPAGPPAAPPPNPAAGAPPDAGSGPIPVGPGVDLNSFPDGTPVVNPAGRVGIVRRKPDGSVTVEFVNA